MSLTLIPYLDRGRHRAKDDAGNEEEEEEEDDNDDDCDNDETTLGAHYLLGNVLTAATTLSL